MIIPRKNNRYAPKAPEQKSNTKISKSIPKSSKPIPKTSKIPTAVQPYIASLDGRASLPMGAGRAARDHAGISDRGANYYHQRYPALTMPTDHIGNPQGVQRDALTGLNQNDPIHLFGHGGVLTSPTGDVTDTFFGGHTPTTLAQHMVLHGGLPENYQGTIYANGCETGVGGDQSFATQLQQELTRLGRRGVTIRGNIGAAHHFSDGTTGVLNPTNIATFNHQRDTLLTQSNQLTTRQMRVANLSMRVMESQLHIEDTMESHTGIDPTTAQHVIDQQLRRPQHHAIMSPTARLINQRRVDTFDTHLQNLQHRDTQLQQHQQHITQQITHLSNTYYETTPGSYQTIRPPQPRRQRRGSFSRSPSPVQRQQRRRAHSFSEGSPH